MMPTVPTSPVGPKLLGFAIANSVVLAAAVLGRVIDFLVPNLTAGVLVGVTVLGFLFIFWCLRDALAYGGVPTISRGLAIGTVLVSAICIAAATGYGGWVVAESSKTLPDSPVETAPSLELRTANSIRPPHSGEEVVVAGTSSGLKPGQVIWLLTARVASQDVNFPFNEAYTVFGPCGPVGDGSWECGEGSAEEPGVWAFVAIAATPDLSRMIVDNREKAAKDRSCIPSGEAANTPFFGCFETIEVPYDVLQSKPLFVTVES